jgi:hypothetical protein
MTARWTSRFPVLQATLAEAAELAAQRVGTKVVKEAKDRVPVDTSSLQRTIRLVGPLSKDNVHYQVIAGELTAQRLGYDYNVYYAPYVEYNIRPYLIPAAMLVNIVGETRTAVHELFS